MPDLEACSLEWVCCLIEVICDHRSYQQLLVFYLLTVLLFLLYCWFAAAATENHKTLPKSVGTFLNPQMQPRQLTAFVVVHPLSQVRLCNPMDCSTSSFPVLRYLPEFAQTRVHWCYPTISSFVSPFSFFPQSFPVSGSFPVSQLFTSGGQSIGASALAPALPMNTQGWFPLGWTSLTSLLSKGLSKIFSTLTVRRHQFFAIQPCLWSSSHICTLYMTTGKVIALTLQTFVGEVMSLLLNTLSRFVITFLPRSKHFLTSWLQSPSAVILKPNKICHCFCFFSYLPWSDRTRCHDLSFMNVEF